MSDWQMVQEDERSAWVIVWALGMIVFNLLFGGVSTQYLANHWFSLDAAFFPWCFVFGLLFGGFTAPLALITLICSLFI